MCVSARDSFLFCFILFYIKAERCEGVDVLYKTEYEREREKKRAHIVVLALYW